MNPALADQHPGDKPAGDPGGHAARRDGPRLAAGRPRPSRHRPPAARITPDTTPVSLTHRSLPSEASRPGPGTRAGLGHRRADSAADRRVPHRRPPGRRAALPPAVWRFPAAAPRNHRRIPEHGGHQFRWTLAALYLQGTRHDSPLAAAVTLVPFSLAVVAGSAMATPALHRIGALWWPTGPSGPTEHAASPGESDAITAARRRRSMRLVRHPRQVARRACRR